MLTLGIKGKKKSRKKNPSWDVKDWETSLARPTSPCHQNIQTCTLRKKRNLTIFNICSEAPEASITYEWVKVSGIYIWHNLRKQAIRKQKSSLQDWRVTVREKLSEEYADNKYKDIENVTNKNKVVASFNLKQVVETRKKKIKFKFVWHKVCL